LILLCFFVRKNPPIFSTLEAVDGNLSEGFSLLQSFHIDVDHLLLSAGKYLR
jgi:hypothetical protein